MTTCLPSAPLPGGPRCAHFLLCTSWVFSEPFLRWLLFIFSVYPCLSVFLSVLLLEETDLKWKSNPKTTAMAAPEAEHNFSYAHDCAWLPTNPVVSPLADSSDCGSCGCSHQFPSNNHWLSLLQGAPSLCCLTCLRPMPSFGDSNPFDPIRLP